MLLDTCALLWLVQGSERLTRKTLRTIQSSPILCVSAITGFEINQKRRAGKLPLPMETGEWLTEAVSEYGLTVISVDLEICLKSSDLPPLHADPCDRFIIATALLKGWPVVTADSRFEQYGVKVLI